MFSDIHRFNSDSMQTNVCSIQSDFEHPVGAICLTGDCCCAPGHLHMHNVLIRTDVHTDYLWQIPGVCIVAI